MDGQQRQLDFNKFFMKRKERKTSAAIAYKDEFSALYAKERNLPLLSPKEKIVKSPEADDELDDFELIENNVLEEPTGKPVTANMAVKILKEQGGEISESEAVRILDFMKWLARIAKNEYL